MPLPLVLGIAAGVAALGGVGTGIHGAVKMKDAKDTMKYSDERHKKNMARFENANEETTKVMDALGKKELEVLSSFETFADLFEKIKNRPAFNDVVINGNIIPRYDGEELKKVSVGAAALLGGIGGAALGTAGGFAAAGATSAAVMALGTASTGTTIATLSGAAATNATLAALGGGAIAAGGGGVALGTTMLGVTTAGVGLLVGGIIFSVTGSAISKKADNAYSQMKEAENKINAICSYLKELRGYASNYLGTIRKVSHIYFEHLDKMKAIVVDSRKTDWTTYTQEEKLIVMNTVLLVGLLYDMCKIQFVIKSASDDKPNKVNKAAINEAQNNAKNVLESMNTDASEIKTEAQMLTDEEEICIALVAVLTYFAKCDGSLSKEEDRVLTKAIDSLKEGRSVSTDASKRIETVRAAYYDSFNDIVVYLEPVELDVLLSFRDLIRDVMVASDGVGEAELNAKACFEEYLFKRGMAIDDCSFKAVVDSVHDVPNGLSVAVTILKGAISTDELVYFTDKSDINRVLAISGRMYKKGIFVEKAVAGDSLTIFFEGAKKDDCKNDYFVIG